MLTLLFIIISVLVGFGTGWVVHRRVSINYKARWLDVTNILNDKQLALEDATRIVPFAPKRVVGRQMVAPQVGKALPNRWTLDERKDGSGVKYYAIRSGFDDVLVGESGNFAFKALVRKDRENAQITIDQMNGEGK